MLTQGNSDRSPMVLQNVLNFRVFKIQECILEMARMTFKACKSY